MREMTLDMNLTARNISQLLLALAVVLACT
jgi:hypothetical protein